MSQVSKRDQPGTQRDYETIFILRPETANDGIAQVNQKIRQVIEGLNGKILKLDNWGKRKLAYEVAGQLKGIYLYWRYLGNSGTVEELERNLRMVDSVIRYYTVKIDEDVVPDARPSEVDEETWAKAATTGPDEEEIVTGQAAPRFALDADEDDYVAPGAEEILASISIEDEEKALAAKDVAKDEV